MQIVVRMPIGVPRGSTPRFRGCAFRVILGPMGFRDDGEALRERVDALESELEKSRAEAEKSRAEAEQLRAERDRAVRAAEHPREAASPFARGARVWVEWRGSWWDGTILSAAPDGRFRVHYDGWSSSWDEDVPPSRLAPKSGPPPGRRAGTPPVVRALLLAVVLAVIAIAGHLVARTQFDAPEGAPALSLGEATPGRAVWIEWQGTWWPGSVRSVDGSSGRVFVHYEDWSSDYDESVAPTRLRAR
jgi:hypothetical protein